MKINELFDLIEKRIGDEYFELLQIASLLNIMNNEINNDKINEKIEEVIEFIRNECKVILKEKENNKEDED